MASNDDVVLDLKEGHSVSEQLQFQDIAHDDLSDPPGAKVQTHNFTNFPDPVDSDDDDSQQANLIKGDGDRKSEPSFWTFAYYQSFFDVDTHQVLTRILGSVVPNPRRNFLKHHIRPNPDLYGPFWICITLVFTTAIAGNMANYFQQSGQDYKWQYDFHKVTFAATAIFGYWWVIPSLIYGLLWWRGSQSGYTFTEILSVYGYSLAIYIPISILWVIQITWLQWLLVMLGMALSGSVLVFTFWPAVKPDNRKDDPRAKKVAFITTTLIVIFHGALAVGFVMYFFHVPPPTHLTTPMPMVNGTTPAMVADIKDEPDTDNQNLKPNIPGAAQHVPGLPASKEQNTNPPVQAGPAGNAPSQDGENPPVQPGPLQGPEGQPGPQPNGGSNEPQQELPKGPLIPGNLGPLPGNPPTQTPEPLVPKQPVNPPVK